MMMVPRSFLYQQQKQKPQQQHTPSPTDRTSSRVPASRPRVPTTPSRPEPTTIITTTATTRMSSQPAPPSTQSSELVHSKPMIIPPRTAHKNSSLTSTQTVRARGQHGGRGTSSRALADDDHHHHNHHRSGAVPPAVAALLAVTSIPPPRRRRRRNSPTTKQISIDELIEEWRRDELNTTPSGVSPALDVLLERQDDCDCDCEVSSIDTAVNEKETHSVPRSVSSESIPSVPSLEPDERSLASWSEIGTPSTPSIRRQGHERKEKVVSSPPSEDCILDHPLLSFPLDEPESPDTVTPENFIEDMLLRVPKKTAIVKPKSTFKSNLTASFQALKSAAKSFSNFTAPSVPPDDLLTRSLLSPRFTSEMRPKPLQGVPNPALRRYLNPRPTPLSPAELTKQFHELSVSSTSSSTSSDTSGAASTSPEPPMIQMQTYDRRSRVRKGRTAATYDDDSSSAPVDANPTAAPTVRQREPRENGDFLRIIVLEMNMRREGKLDSKAVGKARIWLPPRKTTTPPPPSNGGRGDAGVLDNGQVPTRWVGILPEDC